MRNYKYLSLALLLSLIAPRVASAATTVNLSSNGDSRAEVNVKNSFNSTSNQTNTSTSHTSVTIETNGKVQHYESNNGEDVHIKSEDGTSEVNIQNKGTSNSNSNTSIKNSVDINTNTGTISAEGKEKMEKAKKEAKEKIRKEIDKDWNLFQIVERFFKNFFSHK